MIDLFDNCKKWINQDENEISKLISDFILGQFQQATKKTMTDYLKEKFGVDNATLLEQKIEDEIIQKELWNKSTPLFWQNSMYNNPVGEQNTLTIPLKSAMRPRALRRKRRSPSEDQELLTRCPS